MYKKLIMACMAVAAFAAFALPATASAGSPTLTDSSGNVVAKGTGLHATAGSTVFKGSWGEVKCATATLEGEVTKNNDNGEAVEGTITHATFWGTASEHSATHCASSLGAATVTTNVGNGTPWCVKALAGDELQIRGNSCTNAARSITYQIHFPGFSCSYERTTLTGPVKGTYNTNADVVGTINTGAGSEFKLEKEQSIFCPASGSLEMQFSLTTKAGGTLTIH